VIFRDLDANLRSFQKLLFYGTSVRKPGTTSVRNKRRLIDVLGYGMKYLFGTADARDVKRLTAVCDELHAFESKMVRAADYQLAHIHTLEETTRQNSKVIVDLARTLPDSIRNFSLELHRAEADLLDTQTVTEEQVR
jgi:hypothetical protein